MNPKTLLLLLFLLKVAAFSQVTAQEQQEPQDTIATESAAQEHVQEQAVAEAEADPCEGRLVLVVGATGRVGTMVSNRLLQEGFCIRALSRNATKAKETLDSKIEVVVGHLGDGISVAKAFSSGTPVNHVVFAAGGEQADFDAVNNRGVAECAQEAVKAGTQSMVVISSAWVSKPYSLASILFNSLYPYWPMARHLQGENVLRNAAHGSSLNYVILRAGRLRPDEEFPLSPDRGLLYEQGDSFTFFNHPAGNPGMCNTQLVKATLTAMKVKGQYTVEVTDGDIDPDDTKVFDKFRLDGPVTYSSDDVDQCHSDAIWVLKVAAGVYLVSVLALANFIVGWKFWRVGPLCAASFITFCVAWTLFLGPISVQDCVNQGMNGQGTNGGGGTQEL